MDEEEVVVGHRRGRGWRPVGHGLHRRLSPTVGAAGMPTSNAGQEMARLAERAERRADLRAWQRLLPASACFTQLTAAEVHGLWLPPVPPGLPVAVCMPKGEERPRRPQLRVSRLSRPISPVVVDGLRVAPVPETLLACSRDLGLLDAVVLVDAARHLGLCSLDEIDAVAGPRCRGGPALRTAAAWSDARSESPWETLLRIFHVVCEVPVEPQFEVRDEKGAFVARGDLWLRGTTTLHEYDGAVHRDRRTHVNDLARDRRLANLGWTRRGYTSTDLLVRARFVLQEADAALGRPHDRTRLDRWWSLLDESLFTNRGRDRLADRWAHARPGDGS